MPPAEVSHQGHICGTIIKELSVMMRFYGLVFFEVYAVVSYME
jgi:hypothetical protein